MQNNPSLASMRAESATVSARPPTNLREFVAGNWSDTGIALDDDVTDSNTGHVIVGQRRSTAEQIEIAINAAETAHQAGDWRHSSPHHRAGKLLAIADGLDSRAEDIAYADAVCTGVPISQTRTLARICSAAFRAAAALTEESSVIMSGAGFEVERLPLGPAAIIAPWNAPAGIASHKLASALAAGCPVLFKPSEWAPLSGQLITEAMVAADLPEGMVNLLHGDGSVGASLVSDSRVAAVSFTGGLRAGRAVAESCARQIKPAQLELGGNNPLVVLGDADLNAAADGIVNALTTLNGQWCRALGRLIVDQSIAEELLELTYSRLHAVRIGGSLEVSTEMGPLVHRHHRDTFEAALQSYANQGATVHRFSSVPAAAGWFVKPALVTGLPVERALQEVFGPAATVHTFVSPDEAVLMANLAPYGLAAYVYGDEDVAYSMAKRLEAGVVKINSVTLFSPHPDAPRPAWKLSGMGDEGTRHTFEFFRGSRVIGHNKGVRS